MKKLVLAVFCLSIFSTHAQNIGHEKSAFAHTFSIVARDTVTGEMAVGVQSHWFSVGSIVSWGKSGVGVVATQSFVNPAYGPQGLELMENGMPADIALAKMVDEDEGHAFRQVAFLDVNGNVSAYTGDKCVQAAEDIQGNNFSVQANMMLNENVVPAMANAYATNSDLPLAERVVAVMLAAQEAGGDIRGKQSAALIVVGPEKTEKSWEDKKVDLRVDDHENPIKELGRLLKVHRAYEHMNKGDLAVEANDMEKALEEYGAAEKMFPENLEMKYWKAVALANSGRMDEARPIFKKVFAADENWKEMTTRLPASGLLNISEEELETLTK
ncbi:putative Ntn-hydrolase superfamily protein [Gramella sp. Hel_I_59]|uniref:DUF1028 domain-containing protein n=1 Tax=Gramella sp. Hel_I_59 TaxID=1249978 RepID=UPI0011527CEC|nr:DUF1028 domain-containing protein [Gramella sp. Hel_I_59]TQI69169.1 putative Ntn-hydrolase superfamily protein [Gramella sp. Hel_I_59]